jgi:hypothetical protein
MDTLESLSERSIVIMNETRDRTNSASRIGSLFRDVLLWIKNNSSLPIASKTTLGAVIIGDNLSITGDGVLSAQASGGGGTGGNMPEPPADGKFYLRVRKPGDASGSWVELPVIGGQATAIIVGVD